MYKITTVALLLLTSGLAGQTLRIGGNNQIERSENAIAIGEQAGHVTLPAFINSDKSPSLKDFRGKIVILEFWATWCGACLPAMDHLSELKEEFGDKLDVIAVSYESEERVRRYIQNKPLPILHVSDEAGRLKTYFDHYKIPHTVLINTEGNVIGYASPDEITATVIKQALSGKKVNIPIKEDGVRTFDYTKDYFPPAPGTSEKFLLQPKMPGAVPITRRVTSDKSEYQNRRLTLLNQSLYHIYKQAFGIASDSRIVVDPTVQEKLMNQEFCVEVIAPSPDKLQKTFQEGLKKADLPYEVTLKSQAIPVLELVVKEKVNLKESSGNVESGTRFTRINQYQGTNKTIDDFVNDYLNKYIANVTGKSFINETGLTARYDFNFSFEPENPSSFKEELAKIGFDLVPKNRNQQVLLIEEKK